MMLMEAITVSIGADNLKGNGNTPGGIFRKRYKQNKILSE